MYFIGVDGGGTKTQVILADKNANVLGMSTVGSTYIRSITKDLLYETLEEGISLALKDASLDQGSVQIEKSCFGIAGLDSPHDFELLSLCVKELKSVKLDSNPLLLNDAICALRRGTHEQIGVVIVAGTGSNCYGRNELGEAVFVGGLGHILSDEGGSYHVGSLVLHAAAKSFDGRIEKTLLEQYVYESFGVMNMRDVLAVVHGRTFGKREIASLAIICEKAANENDKEAIKILKIAAQELILLVSTAVKKLHMQDATFDLVCVGGSFKNSVGPIRMDFEKFISETYKRAKVVYPTSEPAMGAVYLAIDFSNSATLSA